MPLLDEIEDKVLNDEPLTREEALALAGLPDADLPRLADLAVKVRERFSQNEVDLCSIVSARSGRCAEDCKFCSQSAHYGSGSPEHPMKSVDEIVDSAKKAETRGAKRFCIVTSGGQLSDHDFEIALEAVSAISSHTGMKRCASLGHLAASRAQRLKSAGLNRYHHNLETSRGFFPEICSTHPYQERLKTIAQLKDAGIETCIGGILGLGETPQQRIDFAFELRELDPPSVPINFLNPRPGTPLENRQRMSATEAVKYLAIFRLVLPRTYLRLGGGRLETFADRPELPFEAGANAMLIGDLLTTRGADANSDLAMLRSLGLTTEP